MGIGEQRLSVIINSPVFQEELRKRWEVEDKPLSNALPRENKNVSTLWPI